MKNLATILTFILSISLGLAQEKSPHPSPLETVNKRMDMYNQHNLGEFMKLYAADVKVYTYPDKLLAVGVDNIASIFEPKFAAKSIKVEIICQMYNGDYVINHEIVTENEKETKYVSIYEVKNGLIESVKFVRDK